MSGPLSRIARYPREAGPVRMTDGEPGACGRAAACSSEDMPAAEGINQSAILSAIGNSGDTDATHDWLSETHGREPFESLPSNSRVAGPGPARCTHLIPEPAETAKRRPPAESRQGSSRPCRGQLLHDVEPSPTAHNLLEEQTYREMCESGRPGRATTLSHRCSPNYRPLSHVQSCKHTV